MSTRPTTVAFQNKKRGRATILRAAVLCTLGLAAATATLARAGNPDGASYQFDIAQLPLAQALRDYAQIAGQEIIFTEDLFDGIRPATLQGSYTAEVALDKLLENTGLVYQRSPSGAIMILRKSAPTQTSSAGYSRTGALRLAQSEGTANPAASAASDPQVTIQEVIVTAQKREERLQDVPISIAVMGGETLDKAAAQGLNDMLRRVPGISLDTSQYGGGSTSLTMRGVTAGAAFYTGTSTVGYYLDSVPFGFVKSAFVPDANVYDLERVEVLRGPQGTLYGAGSLNGVVRVLTKDADLDDFELKTRVAYSTTEIGGDNARGDAALNVPIVPGKFAARVVAGYQDLSGWIDKPNRRDANDGEARNVRVKLNAAPNEQLSVGLSAWISRSEFGARNFSPDGETFPSVLDEPRSTDFDAYSLNIDYDFGGVSLTSVTSYIDYEDEMYNDRTPMAQSTPGLFHLILPAKTFAQEINLSSSREGPWSWTAGAIYRDSEDSIFGLAPQYLAPVDQVFESQSYAVFGELTRSFLDGRLEITGGLRYFEDSVQETEDSNLFARTPLGRYADNTFDALTPRVAVTWHALANLTTYASYAEGFRSGAAQNPLILALAPLPPVEPDTLKNYEVGVKGSLWDGRVDYETAVYYMKWLDVQQSLSIPTGAFNLAAVVNGTSASGLGSDVSLNMRVARGLELGVSASWNDLSFDSEVYTATASGPVLLFNESQRLNQSPEWTVGASASYSFPLGGGGWAGRLATSAAFTSSRSATALSGTTRTISSGDQLLLGQASFSIDAPERWGLTLFVENFTDERGVVSVLDGVNGQSRVRPRTIGLQLEYSFGQ